MRSGALVARAFSPAELNAASQAVGMAIMVGGVALFVKDQLNNEVRATRNFRGDRLSSLFS